jgi:catechol 2,3-dioxygenase-like lactoylglutathione lyase family enzyme
MTAETRAKQSAVTLRNAIPVFNVTNLDASLSYYVDILGFNVDWTDPGGVASVSRDECCIFLCQGDQGSPGAWAWIGVGDAEALHAELVARGATVRNPPTNYRWALEMQVSDPDGNVLRLGSDPKADEPYGAWLDMRNDRWIQMEDGNWTRT